MFLLSATNANEKNPAALLRVLSRARDQPLPMCRLTVRTTAVRYTARDEDVSVCHNRRPAIVDRFVIDWMTLS